MSRPSARTRLTFLLIIGAVALIFTFVLRRSSEELIEPGDVQPPGRWHFQAPHLVDATADEELARVLSLPYVAGSREAPSRTGVTRWDPERAANGLNLYVSGHAPEVLLIDMEGRPVHRWSYAFERAFPEKTPTLDTAYIRRALLYPDGHLLAIFQGGGMIKLDRNSKLLWASDLSFYNHLSLDSQGRILAIAKTAKVVPGLRLDEAILEDSIVWLSPDGEVRRRLSLLEAFTSSAFADLIHPLPNHADIFHTNTVFEVASLDAGGSALLRPELLIVSLREIDTVALIDPGSAEVIAAWRGPWRAQHQPVPLATGRLLVFDNQGAASGSRVIEFDPESETVPWTYPGEEGEPLSSPEAGSNQRLANGNTLITESESGRALEIDPDLQVVWEFVSPHRAGERNELVATLFDVVRLPAGSLPFVDADAR